MTSQSAAASISSAVVRSLSGRIQHDLGDLCEVGERPAVVRLAILGVVGEEHAHEINANSANDAMRPTYQPIA